MNTNNANTSRRPTAAPFLAACLTMGFCATAITVEANSFTVSANQLNTGNINANALAPLTTRTYTVAEFDPYEWEGYWAFPVTEFLQTAIADQSGRFQEIEIPVQLNRANPTESIHVEILGFDPPNGPWFQLAQGSVGNLGHYGSQSLWLTIRLDRPVHLNAGDAFAIRVNAAVYHDFSWLGHYLDHYVEGEGFDVSNASYGLPQPGQPSVFDFGFRIVATENLYPSLDHVRTWFEAGEWYAAIAGHPDWTPLELLIAIEDHMLARHINDPSREPWDHSCWLIFYLPQSPDPILHRGWEFEEPIRNAYLDELAPRSLHDIYAPTFPRSYKADLLYEYMNWLYGYTYYRSRLYEAPYGFRNQFR